jgi:signal peptidase I
MILQIALLVSLVCLFFLIILLHIFYSKNESLKKELNEIKVKNTEMEKFNNDLMLIEPGDRVIYPDYGLVYEQNTSNEVHFKVTYELEVLEVSTDKVKVKALDFTSTDRVGKDSKNKAGIINFMKDKWVSKVDIQLVVDNSIKRDIKLRKLGIN